MPAKNDEVVSFYHLFDLRGLLHHICVYLWPVCDFSSFLDAAQVGNLEWESNPPLSTPVVEVIMFPTRVPPHGPLLWVYT